MSKDDATITVDMDRTCTVCHKPGALPNGQYVLVEEAFHA